MRVAFDARYLDGQRSGIGSYSLNLLRALLREDPELELLLIRRRRSGPPLLDEALPRVSTLAFPFPPNSPATRHLLWPWLSRQRFDLFHSPFPLLPARLDRPRLVTVHDIMWLVNPRFNSNSPPLRWVAGTFYRRGLEQAMADAACILTVSEASRRAILEHSPQNVVLYPSLAVKGSPQTIRVIRPVAVDRTVIEAWNFRTVGGPDLLFDRALNYSRLVFSPMSIVAHDDIHLFEQQQQGLRSGPNDWVSLHRDFNAAELDTLPMDTNGSSELLIRNQYRAWAAHMTRRIA